MFILGRGHCCKDQSTGRYSERLLEMENKAKLRRPHLH